MTEAETAPDRVTLLHSDGTYWFFEGTDHIDAVLGNNGGYPVPIRCLTFNSAFEMHDYLNGSVALDTLWKLHPAIVDRLRADNELEEVTANAR